ncbi:MAG: hypothetical protein M3Y08_19845 [Fibrobacterota bacterium]|nr:hypothetical protein [Fibrobacterota bacterium]
MAKFEKALPRLLHDEGGKVDDPIDPGGRTAYGITQKSWHAYRKNWQQPTKDVFDLTPDDVAAFFLMEYWLPLKCKLIASQELADLLLSMAVLQGRGPAVRRLQSLLGVKADGVMGAQSILAIDRYPGNLIHDYCDANAAFFDRLIAKRPASAKYRNGWMNRLAKYRNTETKGRAA